MAEEINRQSTSARQGRSLRRWRHMSLRSLYGRNAGYPAPPVQTRTCSFPASGSSVVLASAVQSRAFRQTLSDVELP
jgi:hypothetical protein